MRAAFDTTVLAYAEGVNGLDHRQAGLALVARIVPGAGMIPVQALGELFHVLVRKAGRSRKEAAAAILSWQDTYAPIPTTPAVMTAAMELAATHQLGIWDAVMLSASVEAGCRVLLSQDMQDGFTWSGTTIVDPFAPRPHPLLEQMLG